MENEQSSKIKLSIAIDLISVIIGLSGGVMWGFFHDNQKINEMSTINNQLKIEISAANVRVEQLESKSKNDIATINNLRRTVNRLQQ